MAPLTDLTIYAEPHNPALPISDFVLDLEHAALVITDPQIDFLSPEGVSWPVFGDSIRDNTPSLPGGIVKTCGSRSRAWPVYGSS
jgi:hypothetical protein